MKLYEKDLERKMTGEKIWVCSNCGWQGKHPNKDTTGKLLWCPKCDLVIIIKR